jgi:hypothetical protein
MRRSLQQVAGALSAPPARAPLTLARQAAVSAALPAASSGTPAAPAAAGYATVTRRRRKELARGRAADVRNLLAFAARYDHARTARLELGQTLKRLGWPVVANEAIGSEGLRVDYALRDQFCAFVLVDGAHYVPPGHPDASATPGFPPLPRDADGAVLMPHESPYPSAPPPWANPAVGTFLDKATAAAHASIRAKGWALVAVPLPLWRVARAAGHQHYARRDLLLQLTLPLAPFESRGAGGGSAIGGGGGGGAPAKA